jgi:hypothetical protein
VAVRVTIDVDHRIIAATFFGQLGDEDILGLASVVASHPYFDPNLSIIWDFTEVTGGTISISAMRELSSRGSILSPKSLHVILAPQDHIFGIFRMGQALAERIKPNIAVVRTRAEANEFLGLEKTG